MRADANTSVREVLLAVLVFALVEYLDPFGISTNSDKVSADLTLRVTSYCYDPAYRDRILVFLVRGEELAHVRNGWPLPLDVYANFLAWLAEYKPAAVFLDIGLIKGGSIGNLDHDPCDPALIKDDAPAVTTSASVSNFADVMRHELLSCYQPVGPAGRGVQQFCKDNDRIPLLLASGNPLLNSWLVDFRPLWSREISDKRPADQAVTSADLLLTCLNQIGTAVPVRWESLPEGYPLRIRTGPGDQYEPSAGLLLYRLYCGHVLKLAGAAISKGDVTAIPPGCRVSQLKDLLTAVGQPDADSLPMVINWGKLSGPATSLDRIWNCNAESERTGMSENILIDATRGISGNKGVMTLCPYHPTVPYMFGEAWPSGLGKPGDLIRDKIVIIGSDIPGYLDRVESPVHGEYPGALVHAMVVDNLLQKGASYTKPAGAWNDFIEGLALLLSGLASWAFRRCYLVTTKESAPDAANTESVQSFLDFLKTLPRRVNVWWKGRLQTGIPWLESPLSSTVSGFLRFRDGSARCYANEKVESDNYAADKFYHNCKVQETSLKLALLLMVVVFIVYYITASLVRLNPLFDFVLPTSFVLLSQWKMIPPAIVGTASGALRLFRHLCLTRLMLSIIAAAILVVVFNHSCMSLTGWDNTLLVIFMTLIMYWFMDVMIDFLAPVLGWSVPTASSLCLSGIYQRKIKLEEVPNDKG